MTEKLYYTDSYTAEFSASIIGHVALGESYGIVLDRTYFYPTSGGQEHDTGQINGITVIDVTETDLGIVHVAAKTVEGDVARCAIDWDRRFDHMQQHTGQHILSAVCEDVAGAPTVSAHMGDESSTIDIDAKGFTADLAREVERRANGTVTRNLPVSIHFSDEHSLGSYPLRKAPKVTGTIRIIEVEKIDYSPCGGTHVRSTGETGMIKIRKWEKIKSGLIRLEFYCGSRALRDYQWKNSLINEIADASSIKDVELKSYIDRLHAETKEHQRQETALRGRVLEYEARELSAAPDAGQNVKLVKKIFSRRDQDEIRLLAQNITGASPAVVLFGTDQGTLLFTKSDEVPTDLAPIFRQVITRHGGKGGGRGSLFQGGIPDASNISAALDEAEALLQGLLRQ